MEAVREIVQGKLHVTNNDRSFKRAIALDAFSVLKLTPGTAQPSGLVVELPSTMLGFRSVDFSRQVEMTLPEESFTLFLPISDHRPTINGVRLSHSHAFYTSLPADIRMLTPPGYLMVFIKLPHQMLSLISDNFNADEVIELSKWTAPVKTNIHKKERITAAVWNSLCKLAECRSYPWVSEAAVADYEDFVVRSVGEYMASNLNDAINSSHRINTRARLVDRALQFLEHKPSENLTVTQLAENLHTSIRTLEYAFLDIVGITPKKYIIARRMNAVQTKLRQLPPHSCSLKSILGTYGVVNTSRFSQDYKRLFGETPLQTLNS